MAIITFLGMGSMGSRMAYNLVNAGHDVCVWNRTASQITSLIKAGARSAQSPYDAVKNADFVISMLRDNDASKSIWCDKKNGALAGMKSSAIAIDCSTLTVEWVRELHQCCSEKNIAFLDAPVAGSRPQAEAAQLIFFVGGDRKPFEQAHAILKTMGSVIHYAGSSGAGASIKLAVNSLFGIQLATMAELIALFKATELDVQHAVEILTSTPVCSPAAKAASDAMLAGVFTPMFPIALVAKDFAYTVETAMKNNATTPIIQATGKVFKEAVKKGFGNDNITGIVQIYNLEATHK